MTARDQLQRLQGNLAALGPRRLMLLAATGLLLAVTVTVGSFYLGKPRMEALYVGLNAEDVSRMGTALREAGITFDVDAEGTKILVMPLDAARARMLLAEKGLPDSATAGYELFDKLGSMSLTSFMQNMTRLRALEGEIARTVQSMKGVKAARVHIVLPDAGSFRRAAQPPSASVVIRTDQPGGILPSAQAIRQLVAAAVPGMDLQHVSVLSTDGSILASGNDANTAGPATMLELEKTVAKDLQEKIRKTLAPYLGIENFESSVTARLNLDKRQINETAFDPDSRTERSVRTVRETNNSQNTNARWAVTVEQNIPAAETAQQPGDQSTRQSDRREELTNYELNSKTIATVSEGYRIETLAVAVIVNRKRLVPAPGGATNPAEAVAQQMKEVERLAASAVGLDAARGDQITVSAVEFLDEDQIFQPAGEAGFWTGFGALANTLIVALTFIAVAMLLIWFVMRPLVRAASHERSLPQQAPPLLAAGPVLPVMPAATPLPRQQNAAAPTLPQPEIGPDFAAAVKARQSRTSIKRLEEVIALNEPQAAALLKEWIRR